MKRGTETRRAVLRDLEHIGLRLREIFHHPFQAPAARHPVRSAHRLLGLLKASVEGARDTRRLKRDFPSLTDLDDSVVKAVGELEATYQEYVTMISRWDWAISLELAAVLMACCRLLLPTRILDTGSGYSSYVLRRYAAEALRPIHVTSVDDDPEWLEETRGYLMRQGLSANDTLTWDEFKGQDRGEFDLVLHDLGHENERLRTLSDVLTLVRPGGAVLLDDVGNPHMERYGPYARRMLSARRFRAYSLRALTRERGYSRYAMLGVRL